MPWQFEKERPIYTQLLEQILFLIISGRYPKGEKIPSVRDLASEASVNPNTMQRALSELERSGLIYSQRTLGRYVTEDGNLIREMKESIATQKILRFFDEMEQLGYDVEQVIELIHKVLKEQNLKSKKEFPALQSTLEGQLWQIEQKSQGEEV